VGVRVHGAGGAVVQHRIDEQLVGDRHLTAVAGQDGQCGGESAPGARAADHDPAAVDAEARGVVVDPAQGGVAVVDLARRSGLRCQPVVDGDDRRAGLGADPAAEHLVAVGAAEDVAAAVDPDQTRCGRAAVRGLVVEDAYVGLARPPGYPLLGGGDLRVERLRAGGVGDGFGLGPPYLRQGLRAEAERREGVQNRGDLGVDQMPGADRVVVGGHLLCLLTASSGVVRRSPV
jgi:CBS domain-containing protein